MASAFKVFLVEDDDQLSNLLAEVLTGIPNVEIAMCATSENVAIDWLAENRQNWDLAIVDLALGTGSGLRILSACRVRKNNQKMVVLSNFLNKEMRKRCEGLGADATFDKASDIDKLVSYCQTFAGASLILD
jgi:two-component system OmpR family response regulator